MIDRVGQVWYCKHVDGGLNVVLIVGGPKDRVALSRGDERWTYDVVNLRTGKRGRLFDGTADSGSSLEDDPGLKRLA